MQTDITSVLYELDITIKKLDWYYNNYNFTLYTCDLLPVFYSSLNLLEDINGGDVNKCIDSIDAIQIENKIEEAVKSLNHDIQEINNMLSLVEKMYEQIIHLKMIAGRK